MKRKPKYPIKLRGADVDQAMYVWYHEISASYDRPLTLDGFVGKHLYCNQYGWKATKIGYDRIMLLLSPHRLTLLRAYALRYNKKKLARLITERQKEQQND